MKHQIDFSIVVETDMTMEDYMEEKTVVTEVYDFFDRLYNAEKLVDYWCCDTHENIKS